MNYTEVMIRIKQFFNIVTDKELGDLLGLTSATLHNRKKRNALPLENILEVLENTTADLRYILYGEMEDIIEPTREEIEKKELFDRCMVIPYYNDINNADGDGNLNCNSLFEPIVLDPKICRHINLDHAVAIKIHTDSMAPTIFNGNTILVDRNDRDFKEGGLFVIEMNGSVMIRRVFMSPHGYILGSDSPKYPQYEVSRDDVIIVARIVKKLDYIK